MCHLLNALDSHIYTHKHKRTQDTNTQIKSHIFARHTKMANDAFVSKVCLSWTSKDWKIKENKTKRDNL